MKCSKCGACLYSGATWCSACGEQVKPPKPNDAPEKSGRSLALALILLVFLTILAGYMPWIVRVVHP